MNSLVLVDIFQGLFDDCPFDQLAAKIQIVQTCTLNDIFFGFVWQIELVKTFLQMVLQGHFQRVSAGHKCQRACQVLQNQVYSSFNRRFVRFGREVLQSDFSGSYHRDCHWSRNHRRYYFLYRWLERLCHHFVQIYFLWNVLLQVLHVDVNSIRHLNFLSLLIEI